MYQRGINVLVAHRLQSLNQAVLQLKQSQCYHLRYRQMGVMC